MGYWGWRSLALLMCLSVWVVSCTDTHDATPSDTPAHTPQETRFARSSRFIPPDDDPLLDTLITPDDTRNPVDVAATLIGRASTPEVALQLHPATCYELASGGIRCLFRITNTHPTPVTDIRVLTQLYNRDGQILREQVSTALHWVVPSGAEATMQVVFPPEDILYLGDRFGAVRTTLISSTPLDETTQFVPLTASVDQLQTTLIEDTTEAQLLIIVGNDSMISPNSARLHITLTDPTDRVAAYRVIELDPSPAPNTQVTLNTIIIARALAHTLTATVYAEGRVD